MNKKNEQEEQENNVLPFVKPAPEDPKKDNWLINMKPGTVFWGKPKNVPTYVIDEYMRGSNIDDLVLIVQNMPVGQPHQYFVDSEIFSRVVSLVRIREVPDEGSVS